MNRSLFQMMKYMNGPVFLNVRYMNGVDFEILARTPVPQLPTSYFPKGRTHERMTQTQFAPNTSSKLEE